MIALVTGASQGIGAAIAEQLAADGYTVMVHYHRHKAEAEALAKAIGGAAFGADLGRYSELDAMIEEILSRYGSIDLLVNNGGISLTGLYQQITDEDGMRVFAVNVGGTMHCTKQVLPSMLARHSGRIINISSVWGEVGAACEVHYSAAKAAIIGFTKALAKEVGPSGITVNCITPGVIDTAMNAMHDPQTMAALAEETPLQRIGTPKDVAKAVSFLASAGAGFITGQILGVNGGFGV